MSQADFDSAVLDIVNEFGTTGIYVQGSKQEYSPATGMLSGGESRVQVKVALVDLTLQSNGLSAKYGTEILAGDKEGYMVPPVKIGGPVISISPGADKLVVNGVTYTVVTFKEVNPTGSDPIAYFLYLRR